jgi:hypothetical protein
MVSALSFLEPLGRAQDQWMEKLERDKIVSDKSSSLSGFQYLCVWVVRPRKEATFMKNEVFVLLVVGGIIAGYLMMEQHHIMSGEPTLQHIETVLSISGSM